MKVLWKEECHKDQWILGKNQKHLLKYSVINKKKINGKINKIKDIIVWTNPFKKNINQSNKISNHQNQ